MWDQEELLKCIWHAFTAFDLDHRGKVPKSQLKILSLNLCNVMKIPFDSRVLEDHFKDENTGPLSNKGYMPYLSNFILNKVKGQYDFATLELFKFCWSLSYKRYLSIKLLHISQDDAFKVWCIFNFLSDNEYPLFVVTQEVEYLLESLMNALGEVCSEGTWAEYHVESSFTKKRLTAWELIELVGLHLFKKTTPQALSAAIDEVFQEMILGVIKRGFLFKKCSKGKNWKEYWSVLRSNSLEYYTSEDLMEIKGIVPICSTCAVQSLPDKDGNTCVFSIKRGDTSFEMSAADKTKKKEWSHAIEKSIQIQKLSGMPPQRQAREQRRQQRATLRATEDKVTELMRQLQANDDGKRKELEAVNKVCLEKEEQVAQTSSELQRCLLLVKELEEALEDERRAKRDEQDMRKLQDRLLVEEALKRAELEQMLQQQQRAPSQSQDQRLLVEAQQQDEERQLQEAMQQLEKLEGYNHETDHQCQDGSKRLGHTNNWENKIYRLVHVLQSGRKGPLMITNWGPGSFTDAELELRKMFWQENRKRSAAAAE